MILIESRFGIVGLPVLFGQPLGARLRDCRAYSLGTVSHLLAPDRRSGFSRVGVPPHRLVVRFVSDAVADLDANGLVGRSQNGVRVLAGSQSLVGLQCRGVDDWD